ncbi:MAG: M28 family peptidase [Pseudohongiella sp.]|nr:M28 family peptidase [Pseudohongiella sp.]
MIVKNSRLPACWCLLFCLLLSPASSTAQDPSAVGPWFGIQLPPPLVPHASPVAINQRGPAPAVVPVGEESFTELEGRRLAYDLQHIVDFSRQSLLARELGGDQLWGRVSGFASGESVVRWAAEQLRSSGIEEVSLQRFAQAEDTALWLPEKWEVRLLGNSAFGAGSEDVVLQSSMALADSTIPGGTLSAPLVYVGKGSPAELMHIDVAGKIAIQQVTPQAHLVFERDSAVPNAQDLMARGALAVITLVDQPGNERVRDFSNCGGPCFNLGGQDSWFLRHVMDAAAERGSLQDLRLQISLQARRHSNLSATNAIAVIPGDGRDETIVLNAHADAWFDGAGDNADGLSVLLALGRHFAKAENHLRRNLVLVVSAGHHTTGLNGPRNAVSMNPELFDKALLIFNLEHVAQRNISPARFLFEDGYRQYTADAVEAPIVVGITNQSAFLQQLFTRGTEIYGTNFVSSSSTMASGEGGGYRSAGVPIVTTMQAPPLYHTSGEVLEVISIPGMERMARFMAFFVKQVDAADRAQID